MKYVLDSSVAVKFVLPEPDSGKAIRLLDEYSKALHELIAPDIFSPEVANALVSAERSARIKKGECASLLYDVMSNAPVFYPANPLLVRSSEPAAVRWLPAGVGRCERCGVRVGKHTTSGSGRR